MSLREHSLDQLAHVRRLLQHFATPHPGVRLLTLDVEAHAAALEPELSVLDAAPFGSLGDVDVSGEAGPAGASNERRLARGSPQGTEAARRQRRLEMLKPTKLAHTVSKQLSATITKQAPHQPANAAAPADVDKPAPEAGVSKTSNAKPQQIDVAIPRKTANVSKHADENVKRARQDVAAATHDDDTTASEADNVELGTLVQRVMQKRRQLRHKTNTNVRSKENDAHRPTALPVRARPNEAAAIQQRPVPSAVALPVSPRTKSVSSNSSVDVTPKMRSNLNGLSVTPATPTRVEQLEPTRTRGTTRPAFFFNALEQREAEESEQALTDRIDHVLREQARRQGVDLT